jgi:hypothetical protein
MIDGVYRLPVMKKLNTINSKIITSNETSYQRKCSTKAQTTKHMGILNFLKKKNITIEPLQPLAIRISNFNFKVQTVIKLQNLNFTAWVLSIFFVAVSLEPALEMPVAVFF